MPNRTVTPSVKLVSFTCPRCGALAHQTWYNTLAKAISEKGLPFVPTEDVISRIQEMKDLKSDQKREWTALVERKLTRDVFLGSESSREVYGALAVENLFLSRCYSCEQISLWKHDGLLLPLETAAITPNQDLSQDIRVDFEEASQIVHQSPRGAAALLRLCLQKLCKQLGEQGDNINANIGNLVDKGLDPKIQQALDVVRVIGNEAVHPGKLDLRDDVSTAMELFRLINLIAEQLISHPKKVAEMYANLPPEKLAQIAKRDGNTNP